jgi:antirestriction protein
MKHDNEVLRVYITDLAAYNNGFLVGEWVSLPLDSAKLTYKIREILAEGQLQCNDAQHHEEWFITDYEWEGDFSMIVDEYADVFALNDLVDELSVLSEHELLQCQFLLHEGYEFDYAIENHDDVIIYDYRSSTSFKDIYELLAEELVDDGCFGEIPDALVHYLDYSKIGRDLSFDFSEFSDGLLGRAS